MDNQKRILMCQPRYFFTATGAIDYKINPWMKIGNPVDSARAQAEWDNLFVLYNKLGCVIEWMTPQPNLSDFVFSANYALVKNGIAALSRFRNVERRREEPIIRAWFLQRAKLYRIAEISANLFFEGQGDAVFFGDKIFAGYGFRTDYESHYDIQAIFSKDVISMKLIDPRFYHLDTCFCNLDDATALYYPDAFDDEGRKNIEKCIPDPIAVGQRDARNFLCNSVPIQTPKTLIVGAGPTKQLRKELELRGYEIEITPTKEFFKAGGSVACLTLNIS